MTIEAFTAAAGLVYDIWSDGPPDGNVTEDADYIPDGGPVLLGNRRWLHGRARPGTTGYFTAEQRAARVSAL
jgi:hypothetical protein